MLPGQQERDRDARQHGVADGVAQQAHPPQHQVAAEDGAGDVAQDRRRRSSRRPASSARASSCRRPPRLRPRLPATGPPPAAWPSGRRRRRPAACPRPARRSAAGRSETRSGYSVRNSSPQPVRARTTLGRLRPPGRRERVPVALGARSPARLGGRQQPAQPVPATTTWPRPTPSSAPAARLGELVEQPQQLGASARASGSRRCARHAGDQPAPRGDQHGDEEHGRADQHDDRPGRHLVVAGADRRADQAHRQRRTRPHSDQQRASRSVQNRAGGAGQDQQRRHQHHADRRQADHDRPRRPAPSAAGRAASAGQPCTRAKSGSKLTSWNSLYSSSHDQADAAAAPPAIRQHVGGDHAGRLAEDVRVEPGLAAARSCGSGSAG